MEQELLILHENMNSPTVLSSVPVPQSLVCCVVFYFFHVIAGPFSFGHCFEFSIFYIHTCTTLTDSRDLVVLSICFYCLSLKSL